MSSGTLTDPGGSIAAFRENVVWGIGCIVFWPVGLLFPIMHWQAAKKPFFIQLAGMPFLIFGAMLSAG